MRPRTFVELATVLLAIVTIVIWINQMDEANPYVKSFHRSISNCQAQEMQNREGRDCTSEAWATVDRLPEPQRSAAHAAIARTIR